MRSLSGASLTLVAVLASGSVAASVGCAKVGELKSMKAFKAANQAYQQQDYKKASQLYEEAIQAAPETQPAHQSYFFLGNSYDNLYKPSKKGEPDNDALLRKRLRTIRRRPKSCRPLSRRRTRSWASCRSNIWWPRTVPTS